MGFETREIVKLTAAAVVASAALRYIWKQISAPEERKPLVLSPKAGAAGAPKAGFGNKAGGGSGLSPEEGVWIYFASQSGTAEGFAKELEEEAIQKGMRATTVDLEDFDAETLAQHKVVIMCIATYGEGDPTDNAVQFFNWLQDKDLPEDALKGVQFTVMSLGNRQYVNFNACGAQCDERMEQLGGERIYVQGVGDDDQNIEEDFEQWKDSGLWPALATASGLGAAMEKQNSGTEVLSGAKVLADLQLRATVAEDRNGLKMDPLVQVGGADILGKWYFQAHECPVRTERELRQVVDFEAGKSAKHLDVDVSAVPHLDWKTADNLEILPRNEEDTVAWFASRFGAEGQLDAWVSFVRAEGVERPVKKPFPTPCSVRDALALYCDLCTAPTKQVLKKLAALTAEPAEREALEGLLNDRAAYQWLTGPNVRLSFQELLELFVPSLRMELGAFLQLCPRQKNRAYTIASSSREDKHTIGVCVSVVQENLQSLGGLLKELEAKGHKAPGASAQNVGEAALAAGRTFKGLCSTMLCGSISVGSKMLVAARPSSFRLPRKSTAPVIMVGAGTGIAPFRGFVREFHAEAGLRAKTMLVFGCQKGSEDFLYKQELNDAVSGSPKVLGELVTAFSREQKDKVYVQHRLRDRAADVKALMGEGGYLYVCGSVAMGASIREALGEILGSQDYVTRLFTEGRYVEELW